MMLTHAWQCVIVALVNSVLTRGANIHRLKRLLSVSAHAMVQMRSLFCRALIKKMKNIMDLPVEVLMLILERVPTNVNIHGVCRRFKAVANSHSVHRRRPRCQCYKQSPSAAYRCVHEGRHPCICGQKTKSHVYYCRADRHPCVCLDGIASFCKAKTHPCTCHLQRVWCRYHYQE